MCLYVSMCMFLHVDSAGRHATVHVWRSATVGIGPRLLPCLRSSSVSSCTHHAHKASRRLVSVSCLTVSSVGLQTLLRLALQGFLGLELTS